MKLVSCIRILVLIIISVAAQSPAFAQTTVVIQLDRLQLAFPTNWTIDTSGDPIKGNGPNGEQLFVSAVHSRDGASQSALEVAQGFANDKMAEIASADNQEVVRPVTTLATPKGTIGFSAGSETAGKPGGKTYFIQYLLAAPDVMIYLTFEGKGEAGPAMLRFNTFLATQQWDLSMPFAEIVNKLQTHRKAPSEISISSPEEGSFEDIELSIESQNCPKWDECTVRAKGLYKGIPVGIEIVIGRAQGNQTGIVYHSIGKESDNLLAALGALYKLKSPASSIRAQTSGDLIALEATRSIMKGKVFFYPDGPESKYAELYTNLDFDRGALQILEKDPEYRTNVVKAFSK